MIIGSLVAEIVIYESQSLKEKRIVVRSLLQRTRNKFNAAAAEVGDADLWQRATLAVAVIGSDRTHAEQQVQSILRFFESDPRLEVVSRALDFQ